MIVTGESLIRY